MTLTRRELLKSGALLGAGAALAGCAPFGGAGAAPVTPGKRLTLSWWIDTGYPSPFTFSNLGPGGVVKESMLFDTLLWKDANGLIPWLAESWEVQDQGRKVVFKLRADAVWHDGRPFTAADVAFSFAYFAQHPFAYADLSPVDSATVRDSRTVAIVLKHPFAPFLHDIAGVLPMIPEHVWASVSDPIKFTGPGSVVGTGPFEFASYAEGQGAYLFKGNDRFFKGRPAFRELAYALVPEPQQPVALEKGLIDTALSTQFDVQALFQSGRYRVLRTPPMSIVRLAFNIDRPPLNQRDFRHAIAYALDRQQIAERVIHGNIIVGNAGVIPPENPWHSASVRTYPYDPGRAKTLLDGIGFDRSVKVHLLAEPDTPDAEIVRSMLAEVGIQVEVITADPKTRTARLKSHSFEMALLKHVVGGDPDFLRRWYGGHAFNAFENGNILHRPDFTQLADEQAVEIDSARRHHLVDRMQAILADELPTLPLYHRRFYHIYNPSRWSHWFNTSAGLLTGIPLVENKLALLLPRA